VRPAVTVITITSGRPELLFRAMESVRGQTYDGPLAHLILIDECVRTATVLRAVAARFPAVRWQQFTRTPGDVSGPERLGRLRNLAVGLAATPWVAFLDDDNSFEPDHVRSLVACANATGVPAVHSERWLYNPDGSPYLEPRMPWKRDVAEGRLLYAVLREKGVFVPGSNVVHDRADPDGHPDPVRMVDTSEWLLARPLLLDIPFCERYSVTDWQNVTPEDNKLLQRLVAEHVPIVSTRRPTLHYQLGGYSNAFDTNSPSAWRPPDPADATEPTHALLRES
jgi:hypothetical protein